MRPWQYMVALAVLAVIASRPAPGASAPIRLNYKTTLQVNIGTIQFDSQFSDDVRNGQTVDIPFAGPSVKDPTKPALTSSLSLTPTLVPRQPELVHVHLAVSAESGPTSFDRTIDTVVPLGVETLLEEHNTPHDSFSLRLTIARTSTK